MRATTVASILAATLASVLTTHVAAQQYDYAAFTLDPAQAYNFASVVTDNIGLFMLSDSTGLSGPSLSGGNSITIAQCQGLCDNDASCLVYTSSAQDTASTGRCLTFRTVAPGDATSFAGAGSGYYLQAFKYDKVEAPICIEDIDLFATPGGDCVCNGALANPVIPREQDTPYGCRNSLIPSGLSGIRRRNRIQPGVQARASFV